MAYVSQYHRSDVNGKTHSVLLSHNVGVTINEHGVQFHKISTAANAFIQLNFHEWFTISDAMGDLGAKVKTMANSIFQQVLNGESAGNNGLEGHEQIISDKVAVTISIFKPQTRHFISVSIRHYFYTQDRKLMFKKSPGITLNQDQFNSLKCQTHRINDSIFVLADTHHHITDEKRDSCHLCGEVRRFGSIDPKESELQQKKMEYHFKCADPSAFIPAIHKINDFVKNGKKDSHLSIILQKNYHGSDFTLMETLDSSSSTTVNYDSDHYP